MQLIRKMKKNDMNVNTKYYLVTNFSILCETCNQIKPSGRKYQDKTVQTVCERNKILSLHTAIILIISKRNAIAESSANTKQKNISV